MALLVWQDDLNIGIDVIDQQHRRIIEMLNHVHVAQASMQRAAVGEVIDEVVDYTMSHFAFEEELMEEAGYPFCAAHKRVHEVFIKRVSEYRMRFQAGEDISELPKDPRILHGAAAYKNSVGSRLGPFPHSIFDRSDVAIARDRNGHRLFHLPDNVPIR